MRFDHLIIGIGFVAVLGMSFLVLIYPNIRNTTNDSANIDQYNPSTNSDYDMVVELFSGGTKVREWISLGRVSKGIDGFTRFVDKDTFTPVTVKGDVIISFRNKK